MKSIDFPNLVSSRFVKFRIARRLDSWFFFAVRMAAAAVVAPVATSLAPLSLSDECYRELASLVPRSPLSNRPSSQPAMPPCFFTPLADYANSGALIPKESLISELWRYLTGAHPIIKAAAIEIVDHASQPGLVFLPRLTRDIERGFPVVIDWPRQCVDIAARRLLLHFFLDAFAFVPEQLPPGMLVTAPMELIARVCCDSIRALIERDPQFGVPNPSEADVSVRFASLRDVYAAITGQDAAALYVFLVEGTLFSYDSLASVTPDLISRLAITPQEIETGRRLWQAYAAGATPLAVDHAVAPRLVWFKFIVPTQDGGYMLQQRQTDLDRLSAMLQLLLTSTAPPATSAPRARGANIYEDESVLLNALSASHIIAYNPGDVCAAMLDGLERRCRFHGHYLRKKVTVDTNGSANLSVFIIRRAHLYTVHRLAEHLREMYASAESGAPLYVRHSVTADAHYSAPKLLIEFDPLFASETTAWLLGFVSEAQVKYGVNFTCALRSSVIPMDVDPLTLEVSSVWWKTFTGEKRCTISNEVISEWFQSHLIEPSKLNSRAVKLDRVGQWLVRARVSGYHDDTRIYALDGSALLKLGAHWLSGLYLFAQCSSRSLAFVYHADPQALLSELLGILPANNP